MAFMEEYSNTESDPGFEFRIGSDPRSARPVMAFIRGLSYQEHQRIELKHKLLPGMNVDQLPLIDRMAMIREKAMLALADAGDGFSIIAADAAKAQVLRSLLKDESIAEGQDIPLRGRLTDEVKIWLFESGSRGQWLVNRVLECEREARARGMKREDQLVKN